MGQVRTGSQCCAGHTIPSLTRLPTPHSFLPGARKEHKGPRSSGITKKKTALKQSMKRRELLFATFAPDGAKVTHCLPTERSKDNRTVEEKEQVLVWVSHLTPSFLGPLIAVS
jgi:hypothetical protein